MISVFLPCRKGSERVPRKNIKPFSEIDGGLIELKLQQLLACDLISKIFLSTNDEEILRVAEKFDDQRLKIHVREERLCESSTSTDDLVVHARELIGEGHILWTHVTSPFVNAEVYRSIIEEYFSSLKAGYDSLMTVTAVRAFLWNDDSPINYDRRLEKWPRTQTIPPVNEVNSAAFISSAENYFKFNDRIGNKPCLFSLDRITAHDIDWPEDFVVAEALVEKNLVNL